MISPEWVLPIITFLVVLVALFGERVNNWWNKPKIKTFLGTNSPYVVYNNDNKYIRIRVENSGKSVVKNCYLKLIVVYLLKDFAGPPKISDPTNLKWASSPQDTRYVSESFGSFTPIFREKIDIPEKGWEFCDLIKTSAWYNKIEFPSSMSGGGIDFERGFDLKNERLLVYVKVMGENIKPKTLAILINNNPSWDQVTAEWYRG